MDKFFEDISSIDFEGKKSDNPLAFKYYNPREVIGSQTMEEHLRFAVAYWHSFAEKGSDPFGVGTYQRPWHSIDNPLEKAKMRARHAFEFMNKLGVPYFCFHDVDVAPAGSSLK
mgnify:FL=1